MFRIEHDVISGIIKKIPLTLEEIKASEEAAANAVLKITQQKEAEATKAVEKQAILNQLGITAEQAKILLS